MTVIPLGTEDWESTDEDIGRLRLHNMYVATNPNSLDGLTRVSRPTLTSILTVGTGPIFGMWQKQGSLDDAMLVVSGEELYKVTLPSTVTLIDDLPGTSTCQFAGTTDRVVIVRDGVAYSTDGTSVVVILMPDDIDPYAGDPAPVGSVTCINGSFLLSVDGLQRFYWMDPGDTDPDPLNFASAERSPDPIVSMGVANDEVWLLGGEGPEVWTTTGDTDAPYQRVSGRVYGDGCAARDTMVETISNDLPALMWVTDARSVVVAQGATRRVSNESVEELLRSATNLRAWPFRYNRKDFYVLTADELTLAFDIIQHTWARWDSYSFDHWRAHLGTQIGSVVYAGDSNGPTIWQLEEGISDDGDPVIREVSGFIPNPGKPAPCYNIAAMVNVGWAEDYDDEPTLELRWSNDLGITWSNYIQAGLGERGNYSKYVVFRSLGQIQNPGKVFEFRCTDPVRFRIDYATLNEI